MHISTMLCIARMYRIGIKDGGSKSVRCGDTHTHFTRKRLGRSVVLRTTLASANGGKAERKGTTNEVSDACRNQGSNMMGGRIHEDNILLYVKYIIPVLYTIVHCMIHTYIHIW